MLGPPVIQEADTVKTLRYICLDLIKGNLKVFILAHKTKISTSNSNLCDDVAKEI